MRNLLQYAEVTVQTEPMVFPEYASTHETSAGKKSSLSYTFGFPFWFSKSPHRFTERLEFRLKIIIFLGRYEANPLPHFIWSIFEWVVASPSTGKSITLSGCNINSLIAWSLRGDYIGVNT